MTQMADVSRDFFLLSYHLPTYWCYTILYLVPLCSEQMSHTKNLWQAIGLLVLQPLANHR